MLASDWKVYASEMIAPNVLQVAEVRRSVGIVRGPIARSAKALCNVVHVLRTLGV